MSEFIWGLKQIGGPGSLGFLVVSSMVGGLLVLSGGKLRRVGKIFLLLLAVSYIVAALPLTANALVARLPSYEPLWRGAGPGDGHLLVVLSGDNAVERARETRRVLDSMTPRCVVVSGDPWFVQLVVEAGVPRDRFTVDGAAETTREQIAQLDGWAQRCGVRRIVLVASTVSMPRIAALVRAASVPVSLAPSTTDTVAAQSGFWSLVPSYGALRISRDALYEHLALAYYRQRQWIP
jgi:uncharacterized SAM-binding protein YcdF (DUF218 family)